MRFDHRSSRARACTLGAALAFTLALGGCAGANFRADRASSVAVAAELPAPLVTDIYETQRETRLGPGDVLTVQVLGVNDLSREVTVDGAGNVAYPLVGTVPVLGMTAPDVARLFQQRLGQRYLQNPEVSVAIKEAVSQRVTLLGAVAQPGLYPVAGNASLTDVLAEARGLSETARASEVVVFRTVDGKRMAARFDVNAIAGGRAPDPAIYPGDRIVIATDKNRQLLRDLAPLTPLAGIFYQLFKI